MYSTSWCGYCHRLARQMRSAGLDFEVVNLDSDSSHDERIKQAAGGFRTVPTLEVRGRMLVNPTLREVQEAAAS